MNRNRPQKRKALLKLFSVILAICISFCASAHTAAGTQEISGNEDDEIIIMTGRVNTETFDGDLVSDAVDAYLYPLLGVHVRLLFIEQEKNNEIMNQFSTYSKMPDALLVWVGEDVEHLARNGKLMPLDDFLSGTGAETAGQFTDPVVLNAHRYNGHIYSLPTLTDRSHAVCLEYRKSIADKYQLDLGSVHTVYDLEPVFEKLRNEAPEIVPISEFGFISWTWDPLKDELGVLPDFGQAAQVVNLYETQQYREICHLINDWQHKGYLKPDNSNTALNGFMRSPWIFSRIRKYAPNLPFMDSADAGEEMGCIVLTDSFVYTDLTQYASWAVSATTGHPEEVLSFIKLMYTDSTLMNLLSYGIEGVHYVIKDAEKGIIGFPEHLSIYNSGYAQFRSYFYGNEFLCYLWEGYPTDLWKKVQQTNETSIRSRAYGFLYDPSPVQEQVDQCKYIVSKYQPLLNSGVGDPDELLKALCEELDQAGIRDIIAEKQQQLEKWLNDQKEETD